MTTIGEERPAATQALNEAQVFLKSLGWSGRFGWRVGETPTSIYSADGDRWTDEFGYTSSRAAEVEYISTPHLFDIIASAPIAETPITTHHESMSNSNPTSPRPTLKLKVAPRVVANGHKSPSTPKPASPGKLKAGAQWSDEYKQRMQADMDALSSR